MLSPLPSPGRLLGIALLGLILLVPPPRASAQLGARLPAPELDGGAGWIGVDHPIHLRDLRGKIVVLDFWTLC
ncbi:MAG TPA: hypothetical protein VFA26_10715 [Gemmataceae bacterium]|nr:hypothetical protein [Gemmataceae bacterium]